ncbi:hypothetical protein HZ996_07965 [Cryomorphaceae bacterium]|nr:hypothetical protein HZ996_07965 [Cryomorphaceae bacterium]
MNRARCILLILTAFWALQLRAQDNHYWYQTFGAHNGALGGNVVAGVRDNSALYYNPGAIGFNSLANLSIGGTVYGYNHTSLNDALGEGIGLSSNSLLTFPQLVAGTVGFNKEEEENPWRLTFGLLTRQYSSKRFDQAYTEVGPDIIAAIPGEERFTGSLFYENNLFEYWIGLGMGRKLGKHHAIGASLFGTIRSQKSRFEVTRRADFPETENITLPDGNTVPYYWTEIRSLQGYSIQTTSLILKLGWAYEKEDWKLGATVTIPSLPIRLTSLGIGAANVVRDQSQLNLGIPYDPSFVQEFLLGDLTVYNKEIKVPATYLNPTSISFGVQRDFPNSRIMFSAEYFLPINRYTVVDAQSQNSIVNPPNYFLGINEDNYADVAEQHRQVLNVGVGYEYNWDSSFYLHAGFRTDFSYSVDQSEYFNSAELSLTSLPLNFYHVSLGGTFARPRGYLTLALDQAFAGKKEIESLVNFRNPVDFDPQSNTRLEGVESASGSAFVYQVTLIVGYTLVFF